MKKEYLKPEVKMLNANLFNLVCLSVDGGDTGIIGGGGGSGPARAPKWGSVWEDEGDWSEGDGEGTDEVW